MRALTATPAGLRLGEAPRPPEPPPGHVVVRVTAAQIHPGDLAALRGTTRIGGLEGAGVVEQIGAGVGGLVPGVRVAFFPVPGTWAEWVTVPENLAVPVPMGVSDATAALMLCNPLTASLLLRAVEEAGGGPVVQTAARSSVGTLVSALAGNVPLVNLVRNEPGVGAVSTSEGDWRDRVRDQIGGGARVVLDAVGGSLTADLAELLMDGGTLITYGLLGPGSTSAEALNLVDRGLTVRGVTIRHWFSRTPEERRADVERAVRLAVDHPELLTVAAIYDLAEHAEAVAHVGRPGKRGTVLLTHHEGES